MVSLVTLTGGTEELVVSWVLRGVGEVTALFTAPLAVRNFTVAALPPAALAETEHDAGNCGKNLSGFVVWNHFCFWFSGPSNELSPKTFLLRDAGETLAVLQDLSLLCTGEEGAAKLPGKPEFPTAGVFKCRSFVPRLSCIGFPLCSDSRALCSRFLVLQYSLFWARVALSYSEAGR